MIKNVLAKPAAKCTLSDIQVARVKSLLDPLYVPHAEKRVRDQLRHGYRFEGPVVVFFDSRPHFRNKAEWLDHDIAKFRYSRTTGQWSLFCRFSDLKWRGYQPFPHSEDLAELVDEMRRDPTCIFFG